MKNELTIEDITIARLGCVTIGEYIFLQELFSKNFKHEIFQPLLDFQQRQIIATMLLISRFDPEWTLSATNELLSIEQIMEISDFAIAEFTRWQPIDRIKPAEKAQEALNWEAIYWRMQLWYPQHPRFASKEAFYNCPLSELEEACAAYQRQRRQDLHLQELGTATLTAAFINANRSRRAKPVKPKDFFYFADNEIAIPTRICNGFFQLAKNGKLPTWAIALAPQDALKAGANNTPVPDPNFWIGEQIVLIEPELWDRDISAAIGIISCNDDTAIAYDNANNAYAIELPEEYRGDLAVIEFSATLKS